MTGTSAAAPHVAGTAALVLAAHPEATPAEVQDLILAAATADTHTDVDFETANLLLFSAFTVEPGAPESIFSDSFETGDLSGWIGDIP